MQGAMDKALEWGERNGLKFSAAKTQVILFTRNYKFTLPPKLRMGHIELEYLDQVKYLGLTLDSKLNWKPHVINKIKECKRLLFQTKQAIGKLWGPTPKNTRWIFNGMIRPKLTYGAIVWGHVTKKSTITASLRKLHRLSLMIMGNFRRSTPTAGLEVITGSMPLDLFVRKEAAMGYRRTRGRRLLDPQDLFTREPGKKGHRQCTIPIYLV